MNLFLQLCIGGAMIAVTVIIHAIALDYIIKGAGACEIFIKRYLRKMWKPLLSAFIVISVFCIHIVNIWLWASLYLFLDTVPLHNISEALYFATVTYTTLGYGDIILGPESRMLSGIEAANGFILFGWTTAFIFEVISQIYRKEAKSF